MPVDVTIPDLGESITEVVLTTWHVATGDWVEKDQGLFEIESDKITTDVPSPESGVITVTSSDGDELEIGALVGAIDPSAERPAELAVATVSTENAEAVPAAASNGSAKATPVARKIAQERGVDLATVAGTGSSGRITKEDVLSAPAGHGTVAREDGPDSRPTRSPSPAITSGRTTRTEKMSKLRQRIAERLVFAKNTTAMLTTFNECDMSQVMALRKRYKEAFTEKYGIGLGFMSFFVTACCSALSKYPRVNAFINGDHVEYHDYVDISIAVSTPKGLTVPILRDAHSRSFASIESGIKELASKARDGQLTMDDLTGGTFTITNGGVFGSLNSTPILNPPQSGILGMHTIKNRPIEDPANPGQIVLRPMMNLALSYDHRIVDGAEAVGFLVHVKECIEDPQRLMLEV